LFLRVKDVRKKEIVPHIIKLFDIRILKDRFTRFNQIGEKVLNTFPTFLVLFKGLM